MANRRSGLGVPLAVVGLCAAIFAVVVVLAVSRGSSGGSPAVGFPVVLLLLAVLGSVLAVVWRSVSRRRRAR